MRGPERVLYTCFIQIGVLTCPSCYSHNVSGLLQILIILGNVLETENITLYSVHGSSLFSFRLSMLGDNLLLLLLSLILLIMPFLLVFGYTFCLNDLADVRIITNFLVCLIMLPIKVLSNLKVSIVFKYPSLICFYLVRFLPWQFVSSIWLYFLYLFFFTCFPAIDSLFDTLMVLYWIFVHNILIM